MSENNIKNFKGFKQVKYSSFSGLTNDQKTGYLWFVRTENDDAKKQDYDIYFGHKHYGHFNEHELSSIKSSIGNIEAILETLDTLTGVLESHGESISGIQSEIKSFLVKSINQNDKVLTLEDGVLSSNIELVYENNQIKLYGKTTEYENESGQTITEKIELGSVNVDDIVKEGVSVETYADAVALAEEKNIGQIIYVKSESIYDPDGEEGEASGSTYEAAPYIVVGKGELMKLAISTSSGDIDAELAHLKTKISGLETSISNKIDSVTLNGVEASVNENIASITLNANDIKLGESINEGETEIYSSGDTISSVLQSIHNSVNNAINKQTLVEGDGIEFIVDEETKNKSINLKISSDENNLIKISNDGGIFAAMYYEGDDTE